MWKLQLNCVDNWQLAICFKKHQCPSWCCETQRFTDQKLSSPIFTCCPSRPSRIGNISIYACLVVSGACLVVSGACLVVLMYIGWYDRNWYIWADIPSDACNWCANAADALMLLMRCCCLCCWCADAADALMLLMLLISLCCWCAYAADELILLMMMLLMHWCCWCAFAADMLMLLMGSIWGLL